MEANQPLAHKTPSRVPGQWWEHPYLHSARMGLLWRLDGMFSYHLDQQRRALALHHLPVA